MSLPLRAGRLENIYVCSYTPTLSALIRARQTMKNQIAPSFVAIGHSKSEHGVGPSARGPTATILHSNEATKSGVLEALRHNTWVHPRLPLDKPITLLDIMENNTPQAEFAFLSSCDTALVYFFPGSRAVIGTLSVVDDDTFYRDMFTDGVMDCTRAASALNKATRAVKQR
ncbi:uncharacterized protein EDB91DRAFT_1154426, partial [Suillus paluster]|uniref:uncharacterized protein n=1 Tax=Suillus paluster TaxID=48578 RepID=UPI001B87AC0A